MTPLEWAHRFADAGIRVHPVWWTETVTDDDGNEVAEWCACSEGEACKSAGKHPIVSTSQSTMNRQPIDEWWRHYPYANLGVNTAGLTVVDVDYRSGGLESYNLLADDLEPTLRVRTGNGFHEYYRGEAGKSQGRLARGIDFKSGASQQVVGPGSTHASGAEYEVVNGSLAQIAATPPRVLELARGRTESTGIDVPVVGEMIQRGEGNDRLVSAAAFFANHVNNNVEVLVGVLFAFAQAGMVEPASQERIREIAHNTMRRHDGRYVDPALGAVFVQQSRAALLNLRELMELPPPEWEVHGLIPRGGLTVLFGDGGTKKSFVALDWAVAAALGRDWMGLQIRPRRTLYVAAEGVSGLPDRIRAWADGHHVELDAVLDAPVWVFPTAISLTQEPAVDALVAMVEEQRADRVVIDTLRRSMPGGDENSTTDIGAVVSACDRIRLAGADVLVIHHSPVGDARRPRGSSSIRDDADVVIGLERRDAFVSRMLPSKLKDAAEFEPRDLTFRIAELGEERSSLYLAEMEVADQAAAGPHAARPTCATDLDNWLIAQRMGGVVEFTRGEIGDALQRYGGTTVDTAIRDSTRLARAGHGRFRMTDAP